MQDLDWKTVSTVLICDEYKWNCWLKLLSILYVERDWQQWVSTTICKNIWNPCHGLALNVSQWCWDLTKTDHVMNAEKHSQILIRHALTFRKCLDDSLVTVLLFRTWIILRKHNWVDTHWKIITHVLASPNSGPQHYWSSGIILTEKQDKSLSFKNPEDCCWRLL